MQRSQRKNQIRKNLLEIQRGYEIALHAFSQTLLGKMRIAEDVMEDDRDLTDFYDFWAYCGYLATTQSAVRDRRYRMKLACEEGVRFIENSHGGTAAQR